MTAKTVGVFFLLLFLPFFVFGISSNYDTNPFISRFAVVSTTYGVTQDLALENLSQSSLLPSDKESFPEDPSKHAPHTVKCDPFYHYFWLFFWLFVFILVLVLLYRQIRRRQPTHLE